MLTVPEPARWGPILAGPLPEHLGLILDGNGRWASSRALARTEGHLAGAEAFAEACRFAAELKIPHLTLFTFALANFARSQQEVDLLMDFPHWLLTPLLVEQIEALGAGFSFLGDVGDDRIPKSTQEFIASTGRPTGSTSTTITILFAYQYRMDETGASDELPDLDLVVRTGGESRLSGFLPRQSMNAELIFTDVLWPDFRRGHLVAAIAEYQSRSRRFGREPGGGTMLAPPDHPDEQGTQAKSQGCCNRGTTG